jgi:serine protease Do
MIRHPRVALLALALASVLGAAIHTAPGQAQEKAVTSSDLRANATVKAVRKAKPSVVAIKVPSASSKGPVGTGVIIDERGYVVTNRHVVAGVNDVFVRLADDSEYPATVLLSDKNTDLAVLKVEAHKPFPALGLARSDDVEVGEDVIAIGHPYGYSFTVSKGIVSALGRRIELPNGVVLNGLIQTDASINPGNSGGPLLNIHGEFIGVNTCLRDGAQGIAFAVNADTVRRVLSEKCSALKVAGVSHGLKVTESTATDAPQRQQVVVASLLDPAAAKGIKDGDVIRAIGKLAVVNCFDVERALWDTKPGQKVPVQLVREGQEITVTITLAGQAATPTTYSMALTPSMRRR